MNKELKKERIANTLYEEGLERQEKKLSIFQFIKAIFKKDQ